MPILSSHHQIYHFAHIPKCGGTSVEDYCKQVGIKIAFLDDCFLSVPAPQPWNISSPQHIDGYSLSRLFPQDFFCGCFAVVREPVARFLSAYRFQITSENTISGAQDINRFIEKDLAAAASTLGAFDNHFLPQASFLLPNTRYQIFQLEHGLEKVKGYIDRQILGQATQLSIGHSNQTGDCAHAALLAQITPASRAILQHIYQDDFRYFHYQLPLAAE